jgi:colicin import membrane protein
MIPASSSRRAWIQSLLLHGLILALLVVGIRTAMVHGSGEPGPPVAHPVQARVVNGKAVERAWAAYQKRRQQQEEARQAKAQALAAQAARAQAEQRAAAAHLAALRAEQARELVAQKAALARLRAEKAAQERALAAVAARQAAASEAQAQALAELKAARLRAARKALERRQAEREAEQAAAARERRRTELSAWVAAIRSQVENAWIRPPGVRRDLSCTVAVTLAPGGGVVTAHLGRCNGSAGVRQSVLTAVFRASPLPMPADPAIFRRHLVFDFHPGSAP